MVIGRSHFGNTVIFTSFAVAAILTVLLGIMLYLRIFQILLGNWRSQKSNVNHFRLGQTLKRAVTGPKPKASTESPQSAPQLTRELFERFVFH